jgi:hypothetical protein
MHALAVQRGILPVPLRLFWPVLSKQIAGTGMKCASVLRQLHAARRPVREPDTDIFFPLPDRR